MKYLLLLVCITALLGGCASSDLTQKTLTHSPDFAPVYPLASDANRIPTGGIYGNRQSDAWFGRGRNFQVGDIITVLLDESTQAARTSNTDLSREAKNTGLPTGLNTEIGKISPFLQGIDLSSSGQTSKGKGVADQKATLKGSLAVTVVEVLANGNLMVRGEKKLGLAEGTEVIQVSGIIRPQDVGPNSTVQSLRLANAQIAYRGNGDVANAAKAGWGTSALHRFWPF
ncbi:FlgH Flagellar basal body L-ring protein [Burkholderiaceae bacterium]